MNLYHFPNRMEDSLFLCSLLITSSSHLLEQVMILKFTNVLHAYVLLFHCTVMIFYFTHTYMCSLCICDTCHYIDIAYHMYVYFKNNFNLWFLHHGTLSNFKQQVKAYSVNSHIFMSIKYSIASIFLVLWGCFPFNGHWHFSSYFWPWMRNTISEYVSSLR